MKVRVLKVDHDQANLDELGRGLQVGQTARGWQMPKQSSPGDIAVWYAAAPRQEYIAWGWVAGTPRPGFRGNDSLYVGTVLGMRALKPVPRLQAAELSGFNRDPNSVIPQAQTVPDEMTADFLTSLSLDPRLMEQIAGEMQRVLPREPRVQDEAAVPILGVPPSQIRAFGEAWSDGGLWDDIAFLALLAWGAADDRERQMRWHHLVMAAGNFKRQRGRRLRPSSISPAGNITFTASTEHFTGPAGLTISRDDPDSWQHLRRSLAGAGAATTTTLLAALWPDSHHILDWRVLAAVAGLGIVADGENDLHLVEPARRNQMEPDLDRYFQVRNLLLRQSGQAGIPLRTTERALYLMSKAVNGKGMT